MSVEIETRFRNVHLKELGSSGQQVGLATAMLSDAHHLGACIHVILIVSIS